MHFFTWSETLIFVRLVRFLVSIGGILFVCLLLYWGSILIERSIIDAKSDNDEPRKITQSGIEKEILEKFKATLPNYDPDSSIDELIKMGPNIPGQEGQEVSTKPKTLYRESSLLPPTPIEFPVTRVIENRHGKQLPATLLCRPSENEIRLRRRRDGRLFTVRLDILSDQDQQFIRALPQSWTLRKL